MFSTSFLIIHELQSHVAKPSGRRFRVRQEEVLLYPKHIMNVWKSCAMGYENGLSNKLMEEERSVAISYAG